MNISEAVLGVVAREADTPVRVTTPFAALPFDSLDMLHLLVAVESETGIHVPNERIGELETVGDLVRIVEAR